MSTAIEKVNSVLVSTDSFSVEAVQLRRSALVQLMRTAMKEGTDHGTIPGTAKPSLWQPGAQKICSLLGLDAEFEAMPDSVLEKDFILHSMKCTLFHIATGKRISSGLGSCNSREEKYGKRKAERFCPKCEKATIIKGKSEYGGGWLCWQRKGGCGAKFDDEDPVIANQAEGKVDNPNIWEQENTMRKMAAKRAMIAATLNAAAVSDIFTQDIEGIAGFPEYEADDKPPHRESHEHLSTFCQTCTDAGVPEGEKVTPYKGHLYLRSEKDGEHGRQFGTDKYCPKCKKDFESSPQSGAAKSPSGGTGSVTGVPAPPPSSPGSEAPPPQMGKTDATRIWNHEMDRLKSLDEVTYGEECLKLNYKNRTKVPIPARQAVLAQIEGAIERKKLSSIEEEMNDQDKAIERVDAEGEVWKNSSVIEACQKVEGLAQVNTRELVEYLKRILPKGVTIPKVLEQLDLCAKIGKASSHKLKEAIIPSEL